MFVRMEGAVHLPLFSTRLLLQRFWRFVDEPIAKVVQVDDADQMLLEVPSRTEDGLPLHIVIDPEKHAQGWLYHRVLRD